MLSMAAFTSSSNVVAVVLVIMLVAGVMKAGGHGRSGCAVLLIQRPTPRVKYALVEPSSAWLSWSEQKVASIVLFNSRMTFLTALGFSPFFPTPATLETF